MPPSQASVEQNNWQMGLIQALCTEVDLVINEWLLDMVSRHHFSHRPAVCSSFFPYSTQNQLEKYNLKNSSWRTLINRRVTSYSSSFSQSVCKCSTIVITHVCMNTYLPVQWSSCLMTVDHRKLIDRNASYWLLCLWLFVPPHLFQSTFRPGGFFLAWGSVFSSLGHPWFEGSGTWTFCVLGFRQPSFAWTTWTLSPLVWNRSSSHLRHLLSRWLVWPHQNKSSLVYFFALYPKIRHLCYCR